MAVSSWINIFRQEDWKTTSKFLLGSKYYNYQNEILRSKRNKISFSFSQLPIQLFVQNYFAFFWTATSFISLYIMFGLSIHELHRKLPALPPNYVFQLQGAIVEPLPEYFSLNKYLFPKTYEPFQKLPWF